MTTKMRPEIVNDEHLTYLDGLRESGVTNMMGATQYVQIQFGLPKGEARDILVYWMETFGNEDR
jgi:predicted mannosyl-3-phosphoglycerate phosphatase (HAD superfamily)